MITVFKYVIELDDVITLEMPDGARFQYLGMDSSGLWCLWFLVDLGEYNDAYYREYKFQIVQTGQQVFTSDPLNLSTLGSFRVNFGASETTYHIFTTEPVRQAQFV